MGKKFVDPRIDTIIDAVEQERGITDIPTIATKIGLDVQLCKTIIGGYIKQQTGVKNLMFHGIEPRFFVLAHGLKEFVDDKVIQGWLDRFYKMKGA